jgi:hypothetical protein
LELHKNDSFFPAPAGTGAFLLWQSYNTALSRLPKANRIW